MRISIGINSPRNIEAVAAGNGVRAGGWHRGIRVAGRAVLIAADIAHVRIAEQVIIGGVAVLDQCDIIIGDQPAVIAVCGFRELLIGHITDGFCTINGFAYAGNSPISFRCGFRPPHHVGLVKRPASRTRAGGNVANRVIDVSFFIGAIRRGRDHLVGDGRVALRLAVIIAGTGQLIPCRAVLRDLDGTGLRIAVERVAVDHEVDAIFIIRIVRNAIAVELELHIAAGRAERNAHRRIAAGDLGGSIGRNGAIRVGIVTGHVGKAAVNAAPSLAAGILANGQIAVDELRSCAACNCVALRCLEADGECQGVAIVNSNGTSATELHRINAGAYKLPRFIQVLVCGISDLACCVFAVSIIGCKHNVVAR